MTRAIPVPRLSGSITLASHRHYTRVREIATEGKRAGGELWTSWDGYRTLIKASVSA
jgi:hypothetical protein